MGYEDIRLIFERVWDQNHAFVPKDYEIKKEVMKRPGFDFPQKSIKKNDKIKASGFVQKQPAKEENEKKNDDSQQQAKSSKKRSRKDSGEDNAKKQKLEDDVEKEELRDSMDVVPRNDIAIDVESLATKYPIVDWKTHVLTENMMYYQIIRAYGSSKNYKIFSEMLDDFNRQDVMDLHRLVQERYDTTSLEGYDLLLWGDLKILFKPNEEDEIWKNQQDYNLISWRLFASCGIYILLMHTGIAIHMMIEKKYPLTQKMLSKMKSRRLEVDQESEMAFELLRIIKYKFKSTKCGFVSSIALTEIAATNEADNTAYGVSAAHTQSNPTSRDNLSDAVICAFLGNFMSRKPDLTFMDEIVESENLDVTIVVTPSNVKTVKSNLESTGVKNNGDAVEHKTIRKNNFRPPVIKDCNSEDESKVEIIPKDKNVSSSTEKIKLVKTTRETVEKIETSKQNKHYPRGNQINWNNLMSQRLGRNFKMINKACYVYGSFEHLHYVCDKKVRRPVWNNSRRVNHNKFSNKMTHPHPNRRFVPQAVLTRSGKINTASSSVNTAGSSVNIVGARINTAIRPVNTACSKPIVNHPRSILNTYKKGYSQVTRPFNINKSSIFNKTVNTVRVKDTTARYRAVVSKNKGKGANAVKGNPQQKEYKEKGVIDSGCSRHMTRNKCYLTVEIMMVDLFPLEMVKATIDESNLWHRRIERKATLTLTYKAKLVNSISKPLHMLHMDLFGPTNVKSLMKKSYCLVVTDDFSRFSWVFFLATKDETSGLLKTFIIEIENQLDHNVKVIRCDNGTEFKNSVMNQFCEIKEIKREFSVARTPQQNGVAERRNRTLIEASRIMLVNSKLPTTFWGEVVNTACYVLNRVLVIKPHNKTSYELIRRRTPLIDFMKPFGCPFTILNIRDQLGKFDGKADEGFFVGYYMVSNAMGVFNKRTRIVEETLNIRFLENATNVTGNGPDWIFNVDSLSKSMNYVPVIAENQTNGIVGKRDNIVAGQAEKKIKPKQEYILIPICTTDPLIFQDPKVSVEDAEEKTTEMDEKKQTVHNNSTNSINTVSTPISTAGPSCTDDDLSSPVNAVEVSNAFEEHLFEQFSPFKNAFTLPPVSNVTPMNDTRIFGNAYDDEDVGRWQAYQTWKQPLSLEGSKSGRGNTRGSFCNLTSKGLDLMFHQLVTQGYTQEEGIDYDEVFAPVARIEAIRLFLAYASFMGFIMYQVDVKSAFLYGTINEEVYVCQPPGFEDPQFPNKVYKVEKALYGLHQAPRAWYETLSTYLIENGFRRGTINKTLFIKKDKGDILVDAQEIPDELYGQLTFFLGLQVQQKKDGIYISQDKYVAEILKKFDFTTVKTTSTPMEPNKALIKDEEADSVDVHLYRSIIRSLMYLTTSRPDIMFAVCACARDSLFDLEDFSNSDYAGASLDKKSTTGDETVYKEWEDRMELIQGSEGFQHIVYFLNTSHIKFALTENPTIYISLIQQFWQTASTSTLEDGEVEITATIDGQLKTITEASLRIHLKLEDADGISSLPNTEFFEQLALIGPKKTSREQFSSNIATAIICLATNRTFNFSKMIFEGMGPIQQGKGSTIPVESYHTPITTPSTSQPPLSSPSRVPTPPHDSPLPGVASLEQDLKQTKKVYGNAYTKLIMRVKKLEHKVKSRLIKTTEIDQNPSISLVQDEGTSWIQEDAEIQGMTSADTKTLLDQEEPTELVEDLGSGEKGEKEISTANISVSTASATPEVSTIAENLVYIRRSAEKRIDKGKSIIKEDESIQKKAKKQLEQ
ncbi:putative ribonuclease H-like domain-containing protein, partial [Tanacetum coccineum]